MQERAFTTRRSELYFWLVCSVEPISDVSAPVLEISFRVNMPTAPSGWLSLGDLFLNQDPPWSPSSRWTPRLDRGRFSAVLTLSSGFRQLASIGQSIRKCSTSPHWKHKFWSYCIRSTASSTVQGVHTSVYIIRTIAQAGYDLKVSIWQLGKGTDD